MRYRAEDIEIRKTTEKSLFIGLDLGQAKDFSALAIIERIRSVNSFTDVGKTTNLNCVHLQRWKLRTSYPAIVADVVEMINEIKPSQFDYETVLAVDATGCGAPVVDLFKQEKIKAELKPILIIGGATVSKENGTYRVPKRDLVSVIQVGLQNKTLKIAQQLPEAKILVRELQNFQVKITDSANDTYGAWREGMYDDLVLAMALAVWTANQPVYTPDYEETTEEEYFW